MSDRLRTTTDTMTLWLYPWLAPALLSQARMLRLVLAGPACWLSWTVLASCAKGHVNAHVTSNELACIVSVLPAYAALLESSVKLLLDCKEILQADASEHHPLNAFVLVWTLQVFQQTFLQLSDHLNHRHRGYT